MSLLLSLCMNLYNFLFQLRFSLVLTHRLWFPLFIGVYKNQTKNSTLYSHLIQKYLVSLFLVGLDPKLKTLKIIFRVEILMVSFNPSFPSLTKHLFLYVLVDKHETISLRRLFTRKV